MRPKDFLFSISIIFYNFFFVKKKYLKAFKNLVNLAVQYLQFKFKNIFSLKILNL